MALQNGLGEEKEESLQTVLGKGPQSPAHGVSAASFTDGRHCSQPPVTYCHFPTVVMKLHRHPGDTPLSVSMRVSPRGLNREKAHLECEWHHPRVPAFISLCRFPVHPNMSRQLDTPAEAAPGHRCCYQPKETLLLHPPLFQEDVLFLFYGMSVVACGYTYRVHAWCPQRSKVGLEMPTAG